jgi:hypothetical protein
VSPNAEPCTLIGYKLYIGSTPALVDSSDSNVWKMIPPNVNLSSAPLPPEGAFYALVAVYRCPDGQIRASQPSGTLRVTSPSALPSISSVSLSGKILTISGSSFGAAPRVTINDVDESDFINAASSSQIVLRGKSKKMNLRSGPNQIRVVNAGQTSQAFVLNI